MICQSFSFRKENMESLSIESALEYNNKKFYLDFWVLVCRFLNEIDIVRLACVCKTTQRVLRKNKEIIERLCYPFKPRFKLTTEQYMCIASLMEKKPTPGKHVNNMVIGEVGSGKTFTAVAYVMRKYKDELAKGRVKVLIYVPPSSVAEWALFFEQKTDHEIISNYKSCRRFFKREWYEYLRSHSIFLTSYQCGGAIATRLLSDTNAKLVVVVDEAHHLRDKVQHIFRPGEPRFAEIIGFTATPKNEHLKDWEVTNLASCVMRSNIPNIEYIRHTYTGYTNVQKLLVSNRLKVKGNIKWAAAKDISRAFMYETLSDSNLSFFLGKKRLIYESSSASAVFVEESVIIERMMKIPKLVALVSLVKQVKAKGEKMLIFDINQNEILFLTLLLMRSGIGVSLYSSVYEPPRRANIIQSFRTNSNTVLLGSMGMLSESHNITEANHGLFVAYPNEYEKLHQAIGRFHRFPQTKTVYVHLLAATVLDEFISLKAVANEIGETRKSDIQDMLKEFDII